MKMDLCFMFYDSVNTIKYIWLIYFAQRSLMIIIKLFVILLAPPTFFPTIFLAYRFKDYNEIYCHPTLLYEHCMRYDGKTVCNIVKNDKESHYYLLIHP